MMNKFESLNLEKFAKNQLSKKMLSEITGGIDCPTLAGGVRSTDVMSDTGCDGTFPASDWISSGPPRH
jgi:bacteriocin-like protein